MSEDSSAKNYEDAEAVVIGFLSRRDHSTGELRKKLIMRDFPVDIIDAVLAYVMERGWVDDVAFAERQAQALVRKGWGPQQISAKLKKHGIDGEGAQVAIESLDEDWEARCRERVRRKFGEDLSKSEQAKAFRHLRYRGFWDSTIRAVLWE